MIVVEKIRTLLSGTRHNWALYTGMAGLMTFFGLLEVMGSSPNSNDRLMSEFSFETIAVYGIIIAPLIEEIAFRGFFNRIAWIMVLSSTLLLLFILIASDQWLIVLPPTALFLFFYFLDRNRESRYFDLAILFNAVAFGMLHYQIADVTNLRTIFHPLAQSSLGLLFAWVAVNFTLRSAIVTHASWNALLFLTSLLFLQFFLEDKQSYNNDSGTITWEQTARYPLKRQQVIIEQKESGRFSTRIEGRNVESMQLLQELTPGYDAKDHFVPTDIWIKYDIEILFTESLDKEAAKEKGKQLMLAAGLVKEFHGRSEPE